MRKTVFLLAVFASMVFSVLAQANPGTMIATPGLASGEHQIETTIVDVRRETRGPLEEVETTYRLFNPNNRILEADVSFPLSAGATITGYALDLDGVFADGVVIGKDRARSMFEQEVFAPAAIDPGLLEERHATVFRTSVYPVPAQGAREVKIRYIHELVGEGLGQTPLVEQTEEGEYYFFLHKPVALSEESPAPYRSLPRQIGIAWDLSLSRSGERDISLAFLKALLSVLPDCGVTLLPFRDEPEEPRTFHIEGGNGEPLVEALGAMPFDGSTDLAALPEAMLRAAPNAEWLLFTDGMDSLQAAYGGVFRLKVDVVTSGPQADRGLLRQLSAESSSLFLDLDGLSPSEAVRHFLAPPKRPVAVHGEGASDVEFSLDSSASTVSVYGRLNADNASVRIEYSDGSFSPEYRITESDAIDGRIVSRAWAARRAERLSVQADRNAAELERLGQRFGVLSPVTSYIVLETVFQYLAYDLRPPKSRSDIVKAWEYFKDHPVVVVEKDGEKRLENLIEAWKARTELWNKAQWMPQDALIPFQYYAPKAEWLKKMMGALAFPSMEVPPEEKAAAYSALARANDAINRAAKNDAQYSGIAEFAESEAVFSAACIAYSNDRPAAAMKLAEEAYVGLEKVLCYLKDAKVASIEDSVARGSPMEGPSSVTALGSGALRAAMDFTATTSQKKADQALYLQSLSSVPVSERYTEYLRQRSSYGGLPSFYFDCAAYFLGLGMKAEGMRIAGNLLELHREEPRVLRSFSLLLMVYYEADRAIPLLRRALALRPDEPQSYRDLALALAERGKEHHAAGDLTESMSLLSHVIMTAWPSEASPTASGIAITALEELNALIAFCAREEWAKEAFVPELDKRLIRAPDLGLRIVLSWDTDYVDADLFVVEPTGIRTSTARRQNFWYIQGREVFTRGYGPDIYIAGAPLPGVYQVEARYTGTGSKATSLPVTLSATVFWDFGGKTERRKTYVFRLDSPGDRAHVANFKLLYLPDDEVAADIAASMVTIPEKPYLISKYEVTQAAYLAVMEDNPSLYRQRNPIPLEPVHNISWMDAIKFCNALSLKAGYDPVYSIAEDGSVTADVIKNGYRLPTEKEWELAAAVGEEGQSASFWCSDSSGGHPHPVGTSASNGLGLFDMAGNVWEWCWDAYGPEKMAQPGGKESLPAVGLGIIKGGSWFDSPAIAAPSVRAVWERSLPGWNVGIRLVRTR